MRSIAALSCALVVGFAAAPASGFAGAKAVAAAQEIAHRYWPHACYPVTVHQDRDLGEDANGGSIMAQAYLGPDVPCEIWLDADHRFKWWQVCHALIHEVGHLYGRLDSDNGASFMYPYPIRRPYCVKRRPA